ncbi:MAG: alanine dehydrogenase [Bacteroidales bacterium]|nr:alanine dehydrogenase [Bacteroidales bacterium]
MNQSQKNYIKFSHSDGLMPKEEMLEVQRSRSKLSIGIPRETSHQERRLGLVPEAVHLLVQNGHSVIIEAGAGTGARFNDNEYSEAGAQVVYSAPEVYQADIILKVAPPTDEEIELMKEKQTIFSAIHLSNQESSFFRAMMRKKITAFAHEYIKDQFGSFPVRRTISEIVGNASIMIAARYLSDPDYGKGNMLGGFSGISPTEVVIIGAGTVAENAARVALGMGATVKVFDDSIYRLRRLQVNIQHRIFTSILQPKVLLNALHSADIVIGAIHSIQGKTPVIVSEAMVREMKAGAVIIDVSIDQGGCVETSKTTTHQNPVFKKYDIIHYCVPNIASQVPHTASYALSNFFTPVLLSIGGEGGVDNFIRRDNGLCKGVYLFKGILTNKNISDLFDLPFQDIDLLLAAFHG